MKTALDKLYETHKNKDVYSRDLAAVFILHDQTYKEDGRKKKKDKQKKNEGNADNTTGSEEGTNESNGGKTSNNQADKIGPIITVHMH